MVVGAVDWLAEPGFDVWTCWTYDHDHSSKTGLRRSSATLWLHIRPSSNILVTHHASKYHLGYTSGVQVISKYSFLVQWIKERTKFGFYENCLSL